MSVDRARLGERTEDGTETEEEYETEEFETLLGAAELTENPGETDPKAVKDEILYSLLLDDVGNRAWGNNLISRMCNEMPAEDR